MNKGFGLIGLLITFGLICVILWYSLDFLKPISVASSPDDGGAIKRAELLKQSLEARDGALDKLGG